MKRALFIAMLVFGGSAAGQPLAPSLPNEAVPAEPPKQPEPQRRPRSPLWPLAFFWNELDAQRVNEGLVGRKNAARDEQRVAETPSLQPRPLSGW